MGPNKKCEVHRKALSDRAKEREAEKIRNDPVLAKAEAEREKARLEYERRKAELTAKLNFGLDGDLNEVILPILFTNHYIC